MSAALSPPIAPMLAQLAHELPLGEYVYEPKWDGVRCVAFVSPGGVDLRSRHGRPMARYFPEVVGALEALGVACVLDGELVVPAGGGFDFAALLCRFHPAAARVERLSAETPASLVAFDLLTAGDETLCERPFVERRARLERLLSTAGPTITVTPATDDPATARRWLERLGGRGVDGVVAKHRALTYQPGKRAMVKVKPRHTVDCVVAGFRTVVDAPAVASLLLGLWDGDQLRHVGVCSSFPAAARASMARDLGPLVQPLAGHPWQAGFGLERSPMGRLAGAAGRWQPEEMHQDWIPLRPRLVCEVTYDHADGARFRHPARFVRWRPDREARSCAIEQLAPSGNAPAEVLPWT